MVNLNLVFIACFVFVANARNLDNYVKLLDLPTDLFRNAMSKQQYHTDNALITKFQNEDEYHKSNRESEFHKRAPIAFANLQENNPSDTDHLMNKRVSSITKNLNLLNKLKNRHFLEARHSGTQGIRADSSLFNIGSITSELLDKLLLESALGEIEDVVALDNYITADGNVGRNLLPKHDCPGYIYDCKAVWHDFIYLNIEYMLWADELNINLNLQQKCAELREFQNQVEQSLQPLENQSEETELQQLERYLDWLKRHLHHTLNEILAHENGGYRANFTNLMTSLHSLHCKLVDVIDDDAILRSSRSLIDDWFKDDTQSHTMRSIQNYMLMIYFDVMFETTALKLHKSLPCTQSLYDEWERTIADAQDQYPRWWHMCSE